MNKLLMYRIFFYGSALVFAYSVVYGNYIAAGIWGYLGYASSRDLANLQHAMNDDEDL